MEDNTLHERLVLPPSSGEGEDVCSTHTEVPARAVQQEKEKTSKLDRKERRDLIRGVPYRVHTPKLKD